MSSMGIDYASEKFSNAIYAMATAVGSEDGRDRLHTAAMTTGHLQINDFSSAELWERFREFKKKMSRVPDEQRGSFRATADSLSDSEVNDLLVEFYNIHVEIEAAFNQRHYGSSEPA